MQKEFRARSEIGVRAWGKCSAVRFTAAVVCVPRVEKHTGVIGLEVWEVGEKGES